MFWLSNHESTPDEYAAFRGAFALAQATAVTLQTLGAAWYVVWLDGQRLTEGPARFHPRFPEYEETCVELGEGCHVIAIQAHHVGVDTRMVPDMPPFMQCEARSGEACLPIRWRGILLPGYTRTGRRINPQLGWIEWCDTRALPANWTDRDFDDVEWPDVQEVQPPIGKPRPLSIGPVQSLPHSLTPIAEGSLVETFGYELDDPPGRFLLRDLSNTSLPPQGAWRRYDLGRVRLGRPRITLDVPAGAVVEFAHAEYLTNGRLAPHINLSAGASANMDHFVARGGVQEFRPHTPKGGRFLEVHVIADGPARFVDEAFDERCYFGEPVGTFESGDPLLDRIWRTGVETLRACAEDAITDNPTRERGQWTGDVVSVAMEITGAAYSDLRLLRRALAQAAQCASEEGIVAGMAPGQEVYCSTYAAQWVSAVVRYAQLTGDRAILEELYPAALRNMAALERGVTDKGFAANNAWAFVDWGYAPDAEGVDAASTLHLLEAARVLSAWCATLGRAADREKADDLAARLDAWSRVYVNRCIADGGWAAVGYHVAVLALRNGLVDDDAVADCIAYIKVHMLDCFPNNPAAPRLSSPAVTSRRLITPYFAHFAMPELIRRGEMDFVLDQYRRCWGWALEDGRTTWLEVFDPRWSHCHEWSGSPTWQLSRYALGLHPRFDLDDREGVPHFAFDLKPGSLSGCKGRIPLPGGGLVDVLWTREDKQTIYAVTSSQPLRVLSVPGHPHDEWISLRGTIRWMWDNDGRQCDGV